MKRVLLMIAILSVSAVSFEAKADCGESSVCCSQCNNTCFGRFLAGFPTLTAAWWGFGGNPDTNCCNSCCPSC